MSAKRTLAVSLLGLLLAASPALAQISTHGKITPPDPAVGTLYQVEITFRNDTNAPVGLEIYLQVPTRDRVQGINAHHITLSAYGTRTLTWTVMCGEPGGTIRPVIHTLPYFPDA